VAFISTKLNLSTTQAQQFWPLFNEFETARKRIRKQIRQLRIDNLLLGGSEEELKTDIRKLFALRQEELDLEKTYAEKFLKVLTPKQLVEYYRLEKEFTKVLLRRLKGRNNAEAGEKDE
jgi:Spy/CpxP family protein refolding chaperone